MGTIEEKQREPMGIVFGLEVFLPEVEGLALGDSFGIVP